MDINDARMDYHYLNAMLDSAKIVVTNLYDRTAELLRGTDEEYKIEILEDQLDLIKEAIDNYSYLVPNVKFVGDCADVKCSCGYKFYSLIEHEIVGGRKSNYCPECGKHIYWRGFKGIEHEV